MGDLNEEESTVVVENRPPSDNQDGVLEELTEESDNGLSDLEDEPEEEVLQVSARGSSSTSPPHLRL